MLKWFHWRELEFSVSFILCLGPYLQTYPHWRRAWVRMYSHSKAGNTFCQRRSPP